MLRIDDLKFDHYASEEELRTAAAKLFRRDEGAILRLQILKRSVDARDKRDIKLIYSVAVEVKNEKNIIRQLRNKKVSRYEVHKYAIPVSAGRVKAKPPVVVGFGPAGIFAAYALARAGLAPIIIERGSRCEERQRKVEEFWETGKLDTNTNVQFGEGGAGAFSDGKLTTGVKDRDGRLRFILDTLVKHGAPKEILYDSKPHIGTDKLIETVRAIRDEIKALGGQFKFNTLCTGFKEQGGRLKAVLTGDGEEIETDFCILAIGHSARDTFKILKGQGLVLEPKGFALGLRIEHLRERIDRAQYGEYTGLTLPASSYKLTYNARDGRGVYSFCMCPGGYVVNSSSEEGGLCVNGMSYSGRDGVNSNSAIVVTVGPGDFPSEDPLAGLELQRRLERAAYGLAGGAVPVQRLGDYLNREKTVSFGEVLPQIKGRSEGADLSRILPEYVYADIAEALGQFGQRIEGFDDPDAILSGIESRTSSPVRIVRNENFQSNIEGLIPCGEGAGYAGGIMSAAADGLKCAEKVIEYDKG